MIINIEQNLHQVLRLGILRIGDIVITPQQGDALWEKLSATCSEIEARYAGLSSGQVPGVAEARALYRSVGLDPTRTRPSSEALLRRALKGKPLYRIHPLVDLFNLASVISLLPVGLYDESKISGDTVTVRLGEQGWGFEGIRKGRINVEQRLCVVDGEGPFGSPTSDSLRTSIAGEPTRAFALFFQPLSGDGNRLLSTLQNAAALSATFLDATTEQCAILEGNTLTPQDRQCSF